MYDLVVRGVTLLSHRIDEEAAGEIGGDHVRQQLVEVGMLDAAEGQSLVLDVADEPTASSVPPGEVGSSRIRRPSSR